MFIYFLDSLSDIEDLKNCKESNCIEKCEGRECVLKLKSFYLQTSKSKWVKVYTLKDLFQVFKTSTDNYMLVAGHTARGTH